MPSNDSVLGKRTRPNDLYNDIECYHMNKKCKYSDSSSQSQLEQVYAESIPASTFKCDATTLTGSLLTATSVSVGSYQ
jgi:hypothetical protein